MRGQAPASSTSCAWLTESTVCAICDAERHGRHAHAERWARSVLERTCV
ncbi:rplA family protein [Pseudomonas viridiflava]|nr:rplA family protein [Pseudomonas viridiflava]TKK24610.1 rplA family protein [Pseudomonas viridiflava]